MVIPDALKIMRLKESRKFCNLGEIAQHGGWGKSDLIVKLENRRKEKATKYYDAKKKKIDARKNAGKNKEIESINKELAQYGF